MWKCMDCNIDFEFPEIKRPDAGLVSGIDILGFRKVKSLKFALSAYRRGLKGAVKSNDK